MCIYSNYIKRKEKVFGWAMPILSESLITHALIGLLSVHTLQIEWQSIKHGLFLIGFFVFICNLQFCTLADIFFNAKENETEKAI